MKSDRILHVAYHCNEAKQTLFWKQKLLNMEFSELAQGSAVDSAFSIGQSVRLQ